MRQLRLETIGWMLGGAVLIGAGALVIVRADIAQRRAAFQSDAGVAYRLLSQRAAQHDAILATLALLGPAIDGADPAERRLPALYPQVLAVLRGTPGRPWSDPALSLAEARSRQSGHAELGPVQLAERRYTLVQAGQPTSFALQIDLQQMVPWRDWPVAKDGPVQVALIYAGHTLVLQPGQSAGTQPFGLTPGFVFSQRLAPASQPFTLELRRATGPSQWPWLWLGAWALLAGLLVAAAAAWQRSRRLRQRAEQLLRFGQVARLNAMGELAAGMAHELNQPLTAIVASAQAARRLLQDDPPALDTVRQAIGQVESQGRRAADVVTRLRRQVEGPAAQAPSDPVDLRLHLRHVLDLLDAEVRRLGVAVSVRGPALPVRADPVALEQVLHNLIGNALQALAQVAPNARTLVLELAREGQGQGVLVLRDSGPGIAPEHLPHLFEPFFTTREGGIGLGLSLCEALVQTMQGTLAARNAARGGAEFVLTLPVAGDSP